MLYRKSLKNIEALRAERARVLREAQQKLSEEASEDTAEEVSFNQAIGNKIAQWAPLILGAGKYTPLVQSLLRTVLPFVVQQGAAKGSQVLAKKLAKEVILGYGKWKLLSIGMRCLERLLSSQAEKIKNRAIE